MLMICAVSAAVAQKNLKINQAFDGRYRDNPAVQEVFITGSQLRGYGLSLYHSLTIQGMPEEAKALEKMVVNDGKNAVDKEIVYRDGGLYYGFYQFDAKFDGYRYIFYLDQNRTGGNKTILIYMEGVASPEVIKKMLK